MERPIQFSAPMVWAILDGRKTMTRRVVKNPEHYGCITGDCPHQHKDECAESLRLSCPYGQTGDRLWVKEALGCFDGEIPDSYEGRYAADGKTAFHGWQWKRAYLPGMFMPRWASRITLEVTAVRVERLQEIGEEDAKAEGVELLFSASEMKLPGLIGKQQEVFGYKNYLWHGQAKGKIADEWGHQHSNYSTARDSFSSLWQSINGKKYPWESNPWVWVIEFTKI